LKFKVCYLWYGSVGLEQKQWSSMSFLNSSDQYTLLLSFLPDKAWIRQRCSWVIYLLESTCYLYICKNMSVFQSFTCTCITQACQIWYQSGSDWPQMGQIRDFFSFDFNLKSSEFFPFSFNLTDFGPKSDTTNDK